MSEGTKTTVLGEEMSTEGNNPQATTDNQSMADQSSQEDYLSLYVGEGKKYSTVEEAAKALAKKAINADKHIEKIQQENEQLRQEQLKAKSVDDILAALNKEEQQKEPEQVVVNQDQPEGLSVDNLDSWYEQRKAQEAKEAEEAKKVETIKANQNKAWELLSSKVEGLDNAKEVVKQYIGKDPSKADIVNNLGSSDPEAFVKFILAVKQDGVQYSSDDGTVNMPAMPDQGLTWSKVKQMEKDNPKLKKDRKWAAKISIASQQNPNFFNQ